MVKSLSSVGLNIVVPAMSIEMPFAVIGGFVTVGLKYFGHAQFILGEIEVIHEHTGRGREAACH